jgi:hypothetical protein
MQAFSQWWKLTGETDFASFVFEVADWLLGYQQDKTGGFINDHQPGTPGYTTAVYLEGIAAALSVAASLADDKRYENYSNSLARGFAFLDRLIIQDEIGQYFPTRISPSAACDRAFITVKYAPTSSSIHSPPCSSSGRGWTRLIDCTALFTL